MGEHDVEPVDGPGVGLDQVVAMLDDHALRRVTVAGGQPVTGQCGDTDGNCVCVVARAAVTGGQQSHPRQPPTMSKTSRPQQIQPPRRTRACSIPIIRASTRSTTPSPTPFTRDRSVESRLTSESTTGRADPTFRRLARPARATHNPRQTARREQTQHQHRSERAHHMAVPRPHAQRTHQPPDDGPCAPQSRNTDLRRQNREVAAIGSPRSPHR